MDILKLIASVKNGRITSTHEYHVAAIETDEDSIRYKTFVSIIDAINSGHLQGEPDDKTEAPNYRNLKLTQKGERIHEFGALTIGQIKNPTLLQKIFNGIIGATSGKLFILLSGAVLLYFYPDIGNTIQHFVDWAITLIKSIIA